MNLLDLPDEIRDKALAKIGLTLEEYKKHVAEKEKWIEQFDPNRRPDPDAPEVPLRFRDEIGFDIVEDEDD